MSWSFSLVDIATDATLADITSAVQSATLQYRLNRPLTATYTVASDNAAINALAADGDPNLFPLSRGVKAYRNGTLRAYTEVQTPEWSADENTGTVQFTSYDPMARFLTRIVYDADGSFVLPAFDSPISGGDLMKQIVDNSVTYDDAVFVGITPATFPVDTTTGTFDTAIPPAIDLSFDVPDGPSTIADLLTLLTDTGALDVVLVPVDTASGYPAGIMAQMNAVNQWGSDLTATVNFDFGTGDKNVAKGRRIIDGGTVRNRIIYELGPPQGPGPTTRWKGNITATELTPVDLSAFQVLEMASRHKYGTRTSVSIYDTGSENDARPLFHKLWETEVTLSVDPRNLLYLTPAASSTGPQPIDDYDIGDTVEVNVGANLLGPAVVAQTQRVYGYNLDIDTDGVERVGELITSADAE